MTKDPYIIFMTESTILQVVFHIISIMVFLGGIVLIGYILILLIKSLKRSIKAFDIYIEKNKKISE
ncbi:MAG: hypothetical protein CVU95_15650 [Firmicutes bacterium HGW-Firmicutes-2]|jgi:hypothetical protein|nr:MAG: hypothetical protein CVU95_15650 [Firmicutes bacterium HGW-Firmicutes-2]